MKRFEFLIEWALFLCALISVATTAGIIVVLAGIGLFSGAVWARTVGVIVAALSAIVNFAWLPWYPIWGIIIIAVDVAVIWALTAHGRDIAISRAESGPGNPAP